MQYTKMFGMSLVLACLMTAYNAADTTPSLLVATNSTDNVFTDASAIQLNNATSIHPTTENSFIENKESAATEEKVSELVTSSKQDTSPTTSNSNDIEDDRQKTRDYSSTTIKPIATTSGVLQKWKAMENITKLAAKKIIKMALPVLMRSTDKVNISASCSRQLFKLLVGFRDLKTWAFSFFDASGKIIDGLLSGTLTVLGEFDQCLDIKATEDRKGKNFGKVMFTGQYCSLAIKPPLPPKKERYKLTDVVDDLKEFTQGGNIINEAARAAQYFHIMSMRAGICVPSGCDITDIQQIADLVSEPSQWSIKVRRCEVKTKNEFSPLIIGVMTGMSFFGFLLVVGSLIDLYHKYKQKKINHTCLEIFVCFSLVTNFKKLVNIKNAKTKMSCLHGFRFLSISWVVLAHTYLNANYEITKAIKKALDFQKDFFFQAVVNGSVAVDTFFFIGGLLVCYLVISVVQETKQPFNIFLYILHRIFRLLPVYSVIIAFTFLAPIFGSGPIFHDSLDPFLNDCYKNWWTNILFVNNFIDADHLCLPQSWYVACDMQLYVAALIVLLPLLRWPRVGLSIAFLGIIASVIATAAITYFYDYPPTMLFVHPDIEQREAYLANTYYKPYTHVAPYCIGLIIGYVLATKPKLKFSLATRIIGWSCAIACNLAVLYGVYDWNVGRDPTLVETLLYSGLHRVAWALGVAWVVVTCSTNQGGIVNYILSWNVWVPLGRLTYTIYLIHPIVQVAILSNARIRLQSTHYFAVWMYFGHLMITIGTSFVASMLVEAPFINLEKLILRAIAGKPRHDETTDHEDVSNDATAPKTNYREPIANGTAGKGHVSHL